MTGPRRPASLAGGAFAAALAASVTLLPVAARAQSILEQPGERVSEGYRSPQHFAFELRFGPYRPDIDSEFNGQRHPYADFFGGRKLMTQAEFDWEVYHGFGSAAVGLGVGYFQTTGTSPVATGTGAPSGDTSTLKVVPVSLSAVYRFDYLLTARNFPLVPYGKLGLDWAYWQITDGNGNIASDGGGGHGRGGTFGWHAGIGLGLVLDIFDPEAAREFDADLGVNHTALIMELRHSDISGLGASGRLHVGDTIWSLGLMFEF